MNSILDPIYVFARHDKASIVTETREMMGTVVRILICASEEEEAHDAIQEAFSEIDRVEHVFSLWISQSEVCRINAQAAEQPVRVSPMMGELLRTSLRISAETRGAFDITIMPLAMLWKGKMKEGKLPNPEEIKKLITYVDYRKIKFNEETNEIQVQPEMKLDFGGIAKGYAVDRASDVLKRRGFNNFIVTAGGDIYVSGRINDKKWKIGIQDPRREGKLAKEIYLSNQAVSTSGDYEQYLIQTGKRYHHILDPKTGNPAKDCVSVTVIAPTCTLSDAYATGLFVLGPEKAGPFLKTHPELEALIISEHRGRLKKTGTGPFRSWK